MPRRKKSITEDSLDSLDAVVEEQENQDELGDSEEVLNETSEDGESLTNEPEPETLEEPQETVEVIEKQPQEEVVVHNLPAEPEVHPAEVEPEKEAVKEVIQKQRPKPKKAERRNLKNQLRFVR